MVSSSLRLAIRTEATLRNSFKAFLMSAMSALSSSVTIICTGLEFNVADAISLSFSCSLLAKLRKYFECSHKLLALLYFIAFLYYPF